MRSNFTDQRHPIFSTSLERHINWKSIWLMPNYNSMRRSKKSRKCIGILSVVINPMLSIHKMCGRLIKTREVTLANGETISLYPWIKEIDFIKEPNSLDRLNDQPIQTLRFFCLSVQKHFLCNFTSIHCIWIKCWPILHFFQQYFLTFISCI